MTRIAFTLCLLAFIAPAYAADPFQPTAAERATIDKCLKRVADEPVLKRASECIGLIADPCADKDNATNLACQERETRIWDDELNAAFQDARRHADSVTNDALKNAQRSWIAFRDAKCAVSEKMYEGSTMAALFASYCKLEETGRRAIEMQAIAVEATDVLFAPR
jgi:uncharacterized protein YecT (DUF1311 family)